ncbi:MAG: homoserine dehydrogenase [Ignisphaera sp.]|nr:homoserine dehydrogenase [Ignisphaera sp.]MCX8167597.1 homoserine dehydrogenase [Ignisphaera sp.]MDW8085417.1 homoserine dehydrogenase [Ignisphaera sp.]
MGRRVKVLLIGFGSVGRALAKVIALKRKIINSRYGILIDVVGVADSKGMALKAEGFDEYELLKLCEVPRSGVNLFKPYAHQGVDLNILYSNTQPDVHVELTPSEYTSGEPGLSNIMYAIDRGAHVVTANKAPLVLKYKEIVSRALSRGVRIKFRATVLGGTPFISTLTSMRSHDVERIEGILNATSNFILTEMHEKLVEFTDALKMAQALGIAEADPTLDIDGVDAAAKIVIISNILERPLKIEEINRESISRVSLRDIIDAVRQGYVIKSIASFDVRGGKASIRIAKIPRSELFAQINGVMNGVRIRSDATEVVFIGRGGGGIETAHSVLDDIVSLSFEDS